MIGQLQSEFLKSIRVKYDIDSQKELRTCLDKASVEYYYGNCIIGRMFEHMGYGKKMNLYGMYHVTILPYKDAD